MSRSAIPASQLRDKNATAYKFFLQLVKDEYKTKHPDCPVDFHDLANMCAERWKTMSVANKTPFELMASSQDSSGQGTENIVGDENVETNYQHVNQTPVKDLTAPMKHLVDIRKPKRPLSPYMLFCKDARPIVRRQMPPLTPYSDVTRELASRWKDCAERSKYEFMADEERRKYRLAMDVYLDQLRTSALQEVPAGPNGSTTDAITPKSTVF